MNNAVKYSLHCLVIHCMISLHIYLNLTLFIVFTVCSVLARLKCFCEHCNFMKLNKDLIV